MQDFIERRTRAAEAKIAQAENFILLATAPEISAGVITANIIWNAMNARWGTVVA
jgi:hypothetical protein